MENDSIGRRRGRDHSNGGLPRSGLHGSGADGRRCRWGRCEGQESSGRQRLIRKAGAELADERFQIQFSKAPRLNLYAETLKKPAPASFALLQTEVLQIAFFLDLRAGSAMLKPA